MQCLQQTLYMAVHHTLDSFKSEKNENKRQTVNDVAKYFFYQYYIFAICLK